MATAPIPGAERIVAPTASHSTAILNRIVSDRWPMVNYDHASSIATFASPKDSPLNGKAQIVFVSIPSVVDGGMTVGGRLRQLRGIPHAFLHYLSEAAAKFGKPDIFTPVDVARLLPVTGKGAKTERYIARPMVTQAHINASRQVRYPSPSIPESTPHKDMIERIIREKYVPTYVDRLLFICPTNIHYSVDVRGARGGYRIIMNGTAGPAASYDDYRRLRDYAVSFDPAFEHLFPLMRERATPDAIDAHTSRFTKTAVTGRKDYPDKPLLDDNAIRRFLAVCKRTIVANHIGASTATFQAFEKTGVLPVATRARLSKYIYDMFDGGAE